MDKFKLAGIVAAVILIIACFFPWVTIESKNITISGVHAEGTNYGKPGYLHLLLILFYLIFSFIKNSVFQKINAFISAINIAWAVRNYFIISACHAGECPVKHAAMYVVLFSSILMMLGVVFSKQIIQKKHT